jgi:hypothetical protein
MPVGLLARAPQGKGTPAVPASGGDALPDRGKSVEVWSEPPPTASSATSVPTEHEVELSGWLSGAKSTPIALSAIARHERRPPAATIAPLPWLDFKLFPSRPKAAAPIAPRPLVEYPCTPERASAGKESRFSSGRQVSFLKISFSWMSPQVGTKSRWLSCRTGDPAAGPWAPRAVAETCKTSLPSRKASTIHRDGLQAQGKRRGGERSPPGAGGLVAR